MSTSAEPLPKMPRIMKKVYEQIDAHPRFKEFDESTRFAYNAAKYGLSWATRQNNQWVRKLWTKLYIDWETDID